jgi:elongation factor P
VQVQMRDVRTGLKSDERFRTQEMVERVRIDEAEFSFLFAEGDQLTFMNQENFEQVTVSREIVGDAAVYLQDGMKVTIESYEGQPLSVTLPDTVTMEIVEADPVVKGQTASSSYKPAVLENGARVMVPPHIGAGTRIVVKTADSSYVERAK